MPLEKHIPLVSVYMITYNHAPFIAQALDSVLEQQTDFDYEIVIGEDCSTDNTREIILQYQEKYPEKITLITSETNVGPQLNSVRTLKACQGKYIATLEGDDYWTYQFKLQMQVDFLDEHNDFSMCYTDRIIVDTNNENIINPKVQKIERKHLSFEDILKRYTPPTQTVMFRSKFLKTEIYDALVKSFNGDTIFFGYLSVKGKIGFLNEMTAAYRINEGGAYTSMDYTKRLEKRRITLEELSKLVDVKYHPFIERSIGIINQRLYVLYLKQGSLSKWFRNLKKVISYDMKHKEISFLRANRLLFSAEITD